MAPLNQYPNARDIYSNTKWQYYSPALKHIAVLYNSRTGEPFYIKNGARRQFTFTHNKKTNEYLHKYGPGPNNRVMKGIVYEARGSIKKRSAKTNTLSAYKARMAKKPGQNKRRTAKNTRVNKLANNVRAGRNISKAKMANLLALVMKYQSINNPFYEKKPGKRGITNIVGNKPTQAQLLKNVKQLYANGLL